MLPPEVYSEVVFAGVSLAAARAPEGLLTSMYCDVPLQVAREGEGAGAVGTPPPLFARGLLVHGGVLRERHTVSHVVQVRKCSGAFRRNFMQPLAVFAPLCIHANPLVGVGLALPQLLTQLIVTSAFTWGLPRYHACKEHIIAISTASYFLAYTNEDKSITLVFLSFSYSIMYYCPHSFSIYFKVSRYEIEH